MISQSVSRSVRSAGPRLILGLVVIGAIETVVVIFVIDLGRSSASDAVVRSVIALARDLGKRVVAEGVETALQQQRLIALGCDEVQGYRYAKPLPAEDFAQGAAVGFGALLQAQAVAATGAT